jgi:hypothetical protein
MNQSLRSSDFKATQLEERDSESGASRNLFEDAKESAVVAALAKTWSESKAKEKERRANVSLAKNRIGDGRSNTEVPSANNILAISDNVEGSFISPRIQADTFRRARPAFVPIQEWEGYVVAVHSSHVLANLIDMTSGAERPGEQAEIPLEEFSEDDVQKLSEGTVFRWAIGYQRLPSGTKMRVSQFVVRDLPQWTRRELIEAKIEAAELAKFFDPLRG